MNIININTYPTKKPLISNLYARMEHSLKSVGADFNKSLRVAKTLAPLLQDQSSNERHLAIITSHDAATQQKVMAIIMLGFPNNRHMLPTLRDILSAGPDNLAIAASIAIGQMSDGSNNIILSQILSSAYESAKSDELKKALKEQLIILKAS